MRVLSVVVPVFILGACASPSPWVGPGQDVVVDSTAFTVFRQGDRVEAYRTSKGAIPSKRLAVLRGALAMEQATGCALAPGSVRGDQAVVTGRLDCDGTAKPPIEINLDVDLDCQIFEQFTLPGQDTTYAEIDCAIVQ